MSNATSNGQHGDKDDIGENRDLDPSPYGGPEASGHKETASAHPVFVSPEELQRHLKIGRTKCYELLAQNDIPSYKIGTLRRIRWTEVERWLEGRRQGSGV